MLSDVGVCGVSESSGRPIFHFFIKENWICAETRHHAEPNINTLFTRNLPCDSDVRQCSHPLMIPLQANLNNGTRAQFECDVLGFVFVLVMFVQMHGAVVVLLFVYVFKLCT